MNNILAVGDILCDIKQNTRYATVRTQIGSLCLQISLWMGDLFRQKRILPSGFVDLLTNV